MKRLILLSILMALFFAVPSAHAQQRYPLGFGNMAFKVDYFRFTDGDLEDLDLENGIYLGIEGYLAISASNLYLGMETGWAGTSSDTTFYDRFGRRYDRDVDVDYVPIEVNAKYVFDVQPGVSFDLGAGLSANYFSIEGDYECCSYSQDDWLFGAQLFADFNYQMNQWFAGFNVKYQFTDDIEIDGEDTDIDASNFRAGAQFGFLF